MPWVKVEQPYRFHGPDGELGLTDLFAGRSQLLVYHFMFADGWSEGCPGCSFWPIISTVPTCTWRTMTFRWSRCRGRPMGSSVDFRRRMGWRFPWFSSHGGSFNEDFGVSVATDGSGQYNYEAYAGSEQELPGLSAFYRDGNGAVYHTYSTYARGLDILVGAYNFLDIAPLGRNEGDDGLGAAS